MKRYKRTLRLIALAFFIALACILPFPINLYRKDNLPKNLIEQVETKDEEDEDNDIKELFS